MDYDYNTQDISTSLINYIFGRYGWYRRFVGGLWEYSTRTNVWWKIIDKPVPPMARKEDYRDV